MTSHRLVRSSAHAPLLLGLAVACIACEFDPDETVTTTTNEFSVDCLGMYKAGNQGGTPVPLLGDDVTISEEDIFAEAEVENLDSKERCRFWMSGPFEPGEFTVKTRDTLSSSRTGTLFIRYGAARWVMTDGIIVLAPDSYELSATGWYDGTFNGPGGQTARINGLLEWCEPSLEDCPYKIDVRFDRQFQVRTQLGEAWGEANACRVLIDRETGAMQMDMQIGSWRGVNVSQLWNGGCGIDRKYTLNANRLTFRSGGVTGPGRYGPWKTTDLGGTPLPHLEWNLPATFWFHIWGNDWSIPLLCGETLSEGGFATQSDGRGPPGGASPGGPSICEFEIGAEPGAEFKLSCSRVVPRYNGSAGLAKTRNATGELHLTTGCDVRYRE